MTSQLIRRIAGPRFEWRFWVEMRGGICRMGGRRSGITNYEGGMVNGESGKATVGNSKIFTPGRITP